jgi:hypothetical protein
MPCIAKKTFEIAADVCAAFITQIKENQKTLLNEVIFDCSQKEPVFTHEDPWTKEQGRLERRVYEVFDADLGNFEQE